MADFRGILYIFADVPSRKSAISSRVRSAEMFGPVVVGQELWFRIGWAVGNNPRRTYCGRTATSKMLSFTSFAEAANFIRMISKRRQDHRFYMVYEADGERSIVSGLEEIVRLDESQSRTNRLPETVIEDGVHRLVARVGKVVAVKAMELLAIIERDGEAAARTQFSDATYCRLRDVLRDAGLMIP